MPRASRAPSKTSRVPKSKPVCSDGGTVWHENGKAIYCFLSDDSEFSFEANCDNLWHAPEWGLFLATAS